MGSSLWWIQTSPLSGSPHDAANCCRPRQLVKGRPRRHKKVTAGTRRTRFTEVGGQGLANLDQEGQPLARSAFAANRQFSGTPVDIVEDYSDDFPGPQAKPS